MWMHVVSYRIVQCWRAGGEIAVRVGVVRDHRHHNSVVTILVLDVLPAEKGAQHKPLPRDMQYLPVHRVRKLWRIWCSMRVLILGLQ